MRDWTYDGQVASGPHTLAVEQVQRELQRLRQGQGLGHPTAVLRLSPALRAHLMVGDESVHETADEVVQVVATLRSAIEKLNGHERRYAAVDFNLAAVILFTLDRCGPGGQRAQHNQQR